MTIKQTCENCKWEPEWKIKHDMHKTGHCKKVPMAFQRFGKIDNWGGNVSFQYDMINEYSVNIEDCTLWEAK